MEKKTIVLNNKGMTRDISISKANNDFAYENFNIRIIPMDKDTLLTVTNEKGNLPIELINDDTGRKDSKFEGTLLGYSVLNQYLILFLHNETTNLDSIIRIEYKKLLRKWYRKNIILNEDLGFNSLYPIETIADYESEDIMKVYWVDGINQPRFINISNKALSESSNNTTFINFVSEFENSANVDITKEFIGESSFKSGIIQYMFTYSNKYGQETNLAYISPIYYISPSNRGASEEEKVNCQFTINITSADTRYDRINIYSIIRTSLGGDFAAYKVTSVDTGNNISYTDNGNYSEAIDVTSLLYVGGREIIASTLTAKDNTLFLGDIMLKNQESDDTIKSLLNQTINFDGTGNSLRFFYTDNEHSLPYNLPTGYYDYDFQLNESSNKVTTFKKGQKYRFAIRFITPSGSRSACYWVGDKVNNFYPQIDEDNNVIRKAFIKCVVPQGVVNRAKELGYSRVELMVAQISELDRNVVAQGFVVPTMFNLLQRFNNAPFAIPSWFTRMRNSRAINRHYEALPSNDNEFAELQCVNNDDVTPYSIVGTDSTDIAFKVYSFSLKVSKLANKTIGKLKRYDITKEQAKTYDGDLSKYTSSAYYKTGNTTNQKDVINSIRAKLIEWGFNSSQIDISETASNARGYRFNNYDNWYDSVVYAKNNFGRNSEHKLISASPILYVSAYSNEASYNYSRDHKNTFFLDESIVSFYSPEINKDNSPKFNDINLKFRIVGIAPVTSNITDYSIETTNNNPNDTPLEFNFNKKNLSNYSEGLSTFPLFNASSKLWYIYPWHKTNSIINTSESYTNEEPKNVLKSKTIANLRFSFKTFYGSTSWNPVNGIYPIKSYDSDEVSLKQIDYNSNKYMYQGNYETLLSCVKSISDSENIEEHYGEDEGYYINNAGNLTEMSSLTDIENSMSSDYGITKEHIDKLCYDPVKIAFKSYPHAVISFKNYNGSQVILPDTHLFNQSNNEIGYSSEVEIPEDNLYLPWENKSTTDGEVSATYNLLPHAVDFTYSPKFDNELYFENNIENLSFELQAQKSFFDYMSDYDLVAVLNKYNDELKAYKVTGYTINDTTGNKLGIPSNINFTYEGTTILIMTFTKSNFTDYVELKVYGDTDELLATIKSEPSEISSKDKCRIPLNLTLQSSILKFKLQAKSGKYSNLYTDSDIIDGGSFQITSGGSYNIHKPEEGESTADKPYFNVTVNLSDISEQTLGLIYQNNLYIYSNGALDEKQYDSFSIYKSDYSITLNKDYNYPYVLIGELYNDEINNQYGGTSDYAIQSNTFVPVYAEASLDSSSVVLEGYTGDTFFQRWDCERILPLKEDSENSIVDMLSLYLESYINLDGRYDNRRGFMSNIKSTLENTNLINKVYSASGSNGGNTIFTSKVLDDKFNLNKFPSQITWTKTKVPTQEVDAWTNITLASTLDMDGNKGPVRALRRFNNTIISFQDKGIAEVLFNSRTQLSTVEGVPIEIANSAKVDGKRYISDKSGCINKWSIVETKNGIYFIDNITSSISLFNGNIRSLSDELGFKNWIGENNNTSIWNPKTPTNFVGYWDRINDDVYFINPSIKQNTICFNEMLGVFTSFYDYGNVPMMVNVDDKFISFKNGGLWEQGVGYYNYIYGVRQPFSITYKVNPNPYVDKIFNNIEYRADMFDYTNTLTNNTFDRLKVWNEYQSNEIEIQKNELDTYPDIQRKFRVWRIDIPRDKVSDDNPYGLNRMRNPWLFINLIKDKKDIQRMEFHNMNVTYFE